MAYEKKLRRDPARDERRSKRLEILSKTAGGRTLLSVKAGSGPNYVSEVQNERGTFGDEFAARVEVCMGKQNGWLDQWLADEEGIDPSLSDPERNVITLFRRFHNDLERGQAIERLNDLLDKLHADQPPDRISKGLNKSDGPPQ